MGDSSCLGQPGALYNGLDPGLYGESVLSMRPGEASLSGEGRDGPASAFKLFLPICPRRGGKVGCWSSEEELWSFAKAFTAVEDEGAVE